MKGVLPIAALVFGIVLGWLIAEVRQPSNPIPGKKSAGSTVTPLENASGIRGEGPVSFSQEIRIQPGDSQEEILKITRGILRDPNPRRRLRNFLVLLDGMTKENAMTICEVFNSWPQDGPTLPADCRSMFLQLWGELAGEDALRSVMRNAPDGTAWTNDIVIGWAQVDRTAVERFIETLAPGSPERDSAALAFTQLLAATDLKEAGAFALKQFELDSKNNSTLLDLVLQQAERANRTDLLEEWYERAPDGPLKSTIAMTTVKTLRAISTDEAVKFLTNVGDAKWRDWDMYWPVAKAYATRDPKAALDWIFTLPKFYEEPAPPGLAVVLEEWHTKEPAAAMEWLLQNTNQPWWPRAARGIVQSLNNSGNQQQANAFLGRFTLDEQNLIRQSWNIPKATKPDPKPGQ
jgi:hypothetical protein